MSQYRSNARMQRVDRHYQATDAVICGEVAIGNDTSFWFQSITRGDVAPIRIGNRVNVQEHCVLHCDTGEPLDIEDDVTLGHGAVVHGARVGKGSLIGIHAVLLGRCVIGRDCMVAAGAVLSPGTIIPDGQVVMGIPGKVVRAVRPAELEWIRANCAHYIELARRHATEPDRFYR